MENQDIFNQIKSAAENAETKDFPGMEKVWNRVEEKLETKASKKSAWRWKKIAVAASLLLVATLGYQFFNNDTARIPSNETVTQTDSILKTAPASDATVSAETPHPAIKENANTILGKQLNQGSDNAVAVQVPKPDAEAIMSAPAAPLKDEVYTMSEAVKSNGSVTENIKFETKSPKTKEVEMFIDKDNKVSDAKKEEPLYVVNQLAKSSKDVKKLDADDIESIMVLKEPLYIINGIEYSEQQLFGPNPTSPYTPLNKQEIETISILQDEKAIELYGDKGKKGVVIITTKNGKPVNASTKAK